MLSQTEIRKDLFLKAMQTDRVTVLLGSAQKLFRIPNDLLMKQSLVFREMKSSEQITGLPEEDTVTFGHFFIWLHAFEPCPSIKSTDAIVDLAIFTEKYRVYHLKNQTSDAIRTALVEQKWRITPGTIAKVYQNVPAGTVLRRLCFLAFIVSYNIADWKWGGRNDGYAKWEIAFCNCPDPGWDYFKQIHARGEDALTASSGGACRFHHHSDIPGWVYRNDTECPYLQGAPVEMPPVEEEKREKWPTAAMEPMVEDPVKEVAMEQSTTAVEEPAAGKMLRWWTLHKRKLRQRVPRCSWERILMLGRMLLRAECYGACNSSLFDL